jgi:hypothetical protein
MAQGGEGMVLVTGAAWYEFWRKGLWDLGEWTHLHATWWVWIARGDLVIGLALVVVFFVAYGSEGSDGRFSWDGAAVVASALAVLALIPGVSQGPAFLALIAPPILLWLLISEGWGRVEGLWRGRERAEQVDDAHERLLLDDEHESEAAGEDVETQKLRRYGLIK